MQNNYCIRMNGFRRSALIYIMEAEFGCIMEVLEAVI